MQTYSSEQEICATCAHWNGERTHDESRFVYVMSDKDVKGVCTLNGHAYAHSSACDEYAGAKWTCDQDRQPCHEEINCWEYMDCGFEEGGRNAATHGTCPAYPHHGRLCASLEATHCQMAHNGSRGSLLPGRRNCQQCNFYNNVLAAANVSQWPIAAIVPRMTALSGCAASHRLRG